MDFSHEIRIPCEILREHDIQVLPTVFATVQLVKTETTYNVVVRKESGEMLSWRAYSTEESAMLERDKILVGVADARMF